MDNSTCRQWLLDFCGVLSAHVDVDALKEAQRHDDPGKLYWVTLDAAKKAAKEIESLKADLAARQAAAKS